MIPTSTERTVADILRAARAKIDTPEKWTHTVLARRADGKKTGARDPSAVYFCMSGAVISGGNEAIDWRAFDFLTRAIDGATIPAWNDHPDRTHAEVLAAFDRAITLAEQSVQS